jgi:hypothetical protein
VARAAAADQHVEVGVEPNRCAVEEAALPGHRDELGVFFGLQLSFLRIQPNARTRVEKRLPQAIDAHLGHLDPARRGAILQVGCLHDVLGVDDGERQPLLGRLRTAVVRVPVLDDGPVFLGQVLHRPRDLNREEIRAVPGAYARLPLKRSEKPLVSGYVSGHGHAALLPDLREDFHKARRRKVRGGVGVRDAECAEVSSELILGGVRRVDAQHMHAFARRQLEAGEDVHAAALGGSTEKRNARHVVVVRDREHRGSQFDRLVDDLARVHRCVRRSDLAAIGFAIVVRIHLQRTAMEHRAERRPVGGVGSVSGHGLPLQDRRRTSASLFLCHPERLPAACDLISSERWLAALPRISTPRTTAKSNIRRVSRSDRVWPDKRRHLLSGVYHVIEADTVIPTHTAPPPRTTRPAGRNAKDGKTLACGSPSARLVCWARRLPLSRARRAISGQLCTSAWIP